MRLYADYPLLVIEILGERYRLFSIDEFIIANLTLSSNLYLLI